MVKLNSQKIIKNVENSFLKENLPILKIGDNVKIGVNILEDNRESTTKIPGTSKNTSKSSSKSNSKGERNSKRVQFYEGTIIAKKNSLINTTITVRKILQGIGVERIFLIHSPKIDSIEVLRSSKVRRAKLYYLRNLRGKASRLKQKF
jgi:large subunit ribosomal protein L19